MTNIDIERSITNHLFSQNHLVPLRLDGLRVQVCTRLRARVCVRIQTASVSGVRDGIRPFGFGNTPGATKLTGVPGVSNYVLLRSGLSQKYIIFCYFV